MMMMMPMSCCPVLMCDVIVSLSSPDQVAVGVRGDEKAGGRPRQRVRQTAERTPGAPGTTDS